MPKDPAFEPSHAGASSGSSTPVGGPGSGAEVVRQATVQVLHERIRLLGVDRSGAYEHYKLQLSRGLPIPRYELAIVDLVKRRFPKLCSYHEIGSGLGTLPLMLAYEGYASVGVERDERRHLTATTVYRKLSADFPQIETNCRLLGAEFPDAVADLDISDSMAILTDFVSTRSAAQYVRLCENLARYRYVVLDLQRFCEKRETKSKQKELVLELGRYGLQPTGDVIDLDGDGYYEVFRGRGRDANVGPSKVRPEVETADLVEVAQTDGLTGQPAKRGRAVLSENNTGNALVTRDDHAVTHANEGELTRTQPFELPPMPRRVHRRRFGGYLTLSALLWIGIPTMVAAIYFGLFASSQYVTSFEFAIRGPTQGEGAKTSGGPMSGPTAMSPDAFVVTDYINSTQAVGDVSHDLDLHTLFSRPNIDFWARLPPSATVEDITRYWSDMVWARFDLISGNVSVSVRAFTPEESLKLAQAVIDASQTMFERLNVNVQRAFVRVADDNLKVAQEQLATARRALAVFRAESGLVALDQTAQAGSAIIDDLRKQLAALQAQYVSIRATSPTSPNLTVLKSQISALEGQIRNSNHPGATPLKAVTPEALAQYESLDLERQVAEKQYADALALRTQAHLTAQSLQSYLALFVKPTLPQASLYPDRLKSVAIVMLVAATVWFIGMLIAYAIRDHLL